MTNELGPEYSLGLLELYVRFLEGAEEQDLEAFCALHLERADELRRLHARREHLEDLLERCLGSLDRRLRSRFGYGEPGVSLPDPRGVVSPGESGELLSKLLNRSPGRYELRGELGHGGQGIVLRAFDRDLRRHLAMKMLLGARGLQDGRPNFDSRALGRFLEEAQITGQLDHPGIVPVHELGLDSAGSVYFTMKLVQGRDLRAILALVRSGEEGWSTTRAVSLLLRVCEAMAYAHDKGVIHRDLKPANIMVGSYGEVYVMDWGLARVRGRANPRPYEAGSPAVSTLRSQETDADSPLLSHEGEVIGTPSYMAPEQARGELEAVDERVDVYAVGAMLYHLLAGHAPYQDSEKQLKPFQVLRAVIEGAPVALEERTLQSPELAAICAQAMERDPAKRYFDMKQLGDDLRAYLEGHVVSAYEQGALAELRKWVLRNRLLSLSLGGGVLALLLGLAFSLYFAVLANERLSEKESEARKAKEALRLFVDTLAPADPFEGTGVRATIDSALVEALQDPRRFEGTPPEVQAAVRFHGAKILSRLGRRDLALPELMRCASLLQSLPAAAERNRSLLDAWNEVAEAHLYQEKTDEALPAVRAALELAAEFPLEHGSEEERLLVLRARYNELWRDLTLRAPGALNRMDTLLIESKGWLGPAHPGVIMGTIDLAEFLVWNLGDMERAEAILVPALETSKAVLGESHPYSLSAMRLLAHLWNWKADGERALALMRRAWELSEQRLGRLHPETVLSINYYAGFLGENGGLDEAESLYKKALARIAENPESMGAYTYLVQRGFGQMLAETRPEEAKELLLQAHAGLARLRGAAHYSTTHCLEELIPVLESLGLSEEAQRRRSELEAVRGTRSER